LVKSKKKEEKKKKKKEIDSSVSHSFNLSFFPSLLQ